MITLWIAAVLMLLLALALVLWPLVSTRSVVVLDQQDANIAVFRRRLAELETEHQAGLLDDDADLAEAREELERQLLGDLEQEVQQPARQARPAFATALVVAVLLPLVAVLLYLQLGNPGATGPQVAAGLSQDEQQQIAFIEEHLAELEARVAQESDDLEAVLMLGRAYLVLQRFDAAVALYAATESRAGQQPVLLVEYAEALGYLQGGNLLGRPTELLHRALAVEPALPKGLWLAGVAAMQGEQLDQARLYWQRLAALLPPDSPTAEQVQQLLVEINAQAAATESAPVNAASLRVDVELAPELASRVMAGSTVFVLARPVDGPRAPLAVVRHPVERLPLQVTLDEDMAMVPGMSLSQFPEVVVEARISRSGEAVSRAGDLVGYSAPVSTQGSSAISIIINEVVN